MRKKYLLITALLLSCISVQAQVVDYMYTNFGGYWESGVGNQNSVYPNTNHELLAFRFGTTVYSTGVNDALLDNNSVTYSAQEYKAFPVQDIPLPPQGTGGSLFFGFGAMWDGQQTVAVTPPPFTFPNPIISEILTSGINGLNLGSAITNVPASTPPLTFTVVSTPDITKVGDGIPDIIITQMADPTTGSNTFDEVYFADINGDPVGDVLFINFGSSSQAPQLGTWNMDFYVAHTGNVGSANTTRGIRLWARDASDFGIDATNVMNIASLRYKLAGWSDPAFLAYNTDFVSVYEAVNDFATTAFETPVIINVLENDQLAPLATTTVSIDTHPASGTATVNPVTNEINFTPADGFTGIITFVYEVCQGAFCNTATVTVIVQNEIEAVPDTFTYDGNNTPSVLENDTINGVILNPGNVTVSIVDEDPTSPLTLNPDGTITVDPDTTPGTYTLEYQICENGIIPANCDTAIVTVTVPVKELIIYNAVTPNGDNENDIFFIGGIENFPNNKVEVYNRWGVKVYSARGYNNNDISFKGYSEGRATLGSGLLPTGTYFYTIEYIDSEGKGREKSGYLHMVSE